MSQTWREILKELDVAAESAAGPGGADGDWYQLHAAFGAKSFVRLLTDGEELAVECAPPGDVARARGAFEDVWELEGDGVPFVARRAFPEDIDAMRGLWIRLAKLTDAVRDEDLDGFVEALERDEPSDDGEDEQEVSEAQDSAAGGDEESDAAETPASAGAAFEPIGDDDRSQLAEGEFAWKLAVDDGFVRVVLGFGEALDTQDYDALERRLVGNLRGKYDVDAKVLEPGAAGVKLDREPVTKIALRVEPDRVVGEATLEETEGWVGEYLETLAQLSRSGIDPLVFLGARSSARRRDKPSKKASGGFEEIGVEESDPVDEAGDEPSGAVLFVADDDVEEEEPAETAAEVVFGGSSVPDEDDPLEPGRFDDPRLKRADATTSLVDVVLRHPGYSDKSIGQVLSILLSIEYSASLEISSRAPAVIAWGVARARANTMKTVIEGAGGRVLLVEPGTFGEE